MKNKITKILTTISIISFIMINFTGCFYDVNSGGNLSNHEGVLVFLTLCGISGLVSWILRMPVIGTILLCFVIIG